MGRVGGMTFEILIGRGKKGGFAISETKRGLRKNIRVF